MNWKVIFFICLVFFAVTLVTNVANTMTISMNSLRDMIDVNNRAILDFGSIEPAGDPIDNPVDPH